jgi:hypothetical protein
VLYLIADGLKRRDRWLAAGVFAFAAVIAWALFIGALWSWFGWLSSGASLSSFSFSRLVLELLVLGVALDDMRRFKFPFIASIAVFVGWFFVLDLLSGGGNWSAFVTLFVGIAYLFAGSVSSGPAGFWLHFAAGLLIGGSFLYWWHSSDFDWGLISVVALFYVAISTAEALELGRVRVARAAGGRVALRQRVVAQDRRLAGRLQRLVLVQGWVPAPLRVRRLPARVPRARVALRRRGLAATGLRSSAPPGRARSRRR